MITLCCQITRGFNFVKSIDGTDGLYNSINLFFPFISFHSNTSKYISVDYISICRSYLYNSINLFLFLFFHANTSKYT